MTKGDSVELSETLSNLPPSLIPSWKRSMKYGVDPSRAEDDLLTGGELSDRKERMHSLIQSASTILQQLYYQLRNSPFLVILSDRDGYIIETYGDPPFTDRARKVWLDTGANWHENVKGTNAIGTVLAEKQSISVVGGQHYCRENHFLACYAAPLFSPTGELLGALDISGDARMHHPHTMGMVIAAAQACQARLLLQSAENELTLSLRESDALANGYGRPLISVDAHGVVTRINQEAAKILGLPPSQCVGQPLSRWFDRDADRILSIKDASTLKVRMKDHAAPDGSPKTWVVQPVRDHRNRIFRSLLNPLSDSQPHSPSHQGSSSRPKDFSSKDIVAECPKIRKILQLAHHAARTDTTILLRGETGTGKEIVAREIHRSSGRRGPLVVVNCGALPEPLIESELFGYEKGAFTGARSNGQMGKFEAAREGTLFLDEIGELPLSSQAALLRVLEEKKVTRIGSHQPISVDVRIIAATNKDLLRESRENRFRMDLYYRLCEMEIVLPPLRERSDLNTLAEHFLDLFAKELGHPTFILDEDARRALSEYHWPGNIRELRQVLRQAVFHAWFLRNASVVSREDLSFPDGREDHALRMNRSLEQHEEEAIAQVIRETGGNLAEAARILGIGRTTLYRKLRQYPHLVHIRNQAKKEAP